MVASTKIFLIFVVEGHLLSIKRRAQSKNLENARGVT